MKPFALPYFNLQYNKENCRLLHTVIDTSHGTPYMLILMSKDEDKLTRDK